MTTICYSDNIIAYDSRITSGSHIIDDDYDKHIYSEGVHFFLAGACDGFNAFVYYYLNPTEKPVDVEIQALVYHEDTGSLYSVLFDEDSNSLSKFLVGLDKKCAIGAGWQYASSALDFGKTAKEAVKFAATKTATTNNRVRTFRLK